MSTPALAALRMNELALHGLAKIIRSGFTPRSSTWLISPFEAQSKPVPSAARRRRTYGSGLHFTAVQWRISLAQTRTEEERGNLTIVRLNLGEKLLPAFVLPVHAAQISDKEGFLGIGFPGCAEMERVHHPLTEMNVWVAAVQRREPRNGDLVVIMTVRVLEAVRVILRVYDMRRREESVYESIGKVLFVVRARERGGKRGRARDDVKVYRAVRREDLELRHSNGVGVRRSGNIYVVVYGLWRRGCLSARWCGLEDCGVEAGEFPGNGKNSRFGYSCRNPNYRTYRRGRENEPGGIGTVTMRFPSVEVGSSLRKARTGTRVLEVVVERWGGELRRTDREKRVRQRLIYATEQCSPVKEVLLQRTDMSGDVDVGLGGTTYHERMTTCKVKVSNQFIQSHDNAQQSGMAMSSRAGRTIKEGQRGVHAAQRHADGR